MRRLLLPTFMSLPGDAQGSNAIANARMKILPLLVLLTSLSVTLHAETIDDGIMMPSHTLFTGNVYSHDSWNPYWEGFLHRTNGNLGTVATQTDAWSANYGVTSRLNVIALVPYVWTGASQGMLHGMKGFQDITLAAKYRFPDRPFPKYGSLGAIAAVSGGIPLTNYTPDFPPLSIVSAGYLKRRAAADGSSTTRFPVSILLNGASVPAAFAGLAPGFVGLFQVNVRIPGNAPSGDAVTLAIGVGGATSNTVTMALQ